MAARWPVMEAWLAAMLAAMLTTTPAGALPFSILCPKASPGEIVVCAVTDPPRSPYRLPAEIPQLPEFGTRAADSVSRERNALFDHDAGGPGSCSAVGPSGASGCQFRQHRRNTEQRANARDKRGRVYDSPPR